MADPQTPMIKLLHFNDRKAVEELTAFLIKQEVWFDVRLPLKRAKWSVSFGTHIEVPKKLMKSIIKA